MTPGGIRRACAALITLILVFAVATPAAANYETDEGANAPVVFDVLIMRPIGFVALGLGSGLFVASLPIALVSRPQDIDKPFHMLVARPSKFLWGDPIGQH